jgi:hypothetical protein
MLEVHLAQHAGVDDDVEEVHCSSAELPRNRIGAPAASDDRAYLLAAPSMKDSHWSSP